MEAGESWNGSRCLIYRLKTRTYRSAMMTHTAVTISTLSKNAAEIIVAAATSRIPVIPEYIKRYTAVRPRRANEM
jgi:cytosine/uracil/thiamine/allantoin permease